jgi:hypothetical protein
MSTPPQNFNLLNTIRIECEVSQRNSYHNYVFGKLGESEDPRIDGDVLDCIEICQEFESLHETDHFKSAIDEVYVGDEAFPDHQLHAVWQYHKNYDEAAQEYDVIIAKKAFEKAFEGVED